MKNIFEVLKQKESELNQLQKEIDALRIAARLLADDSDAAVNGAKSIALPAVPPVQMPSTAARPAGPPAGKEGAYSAAWDNAPRQFP